MQLPFRPHGNATLNPNTVQNKRNVASRNAIVIGSREDE